MIDREDTITHGNGLLLCDVEKWGIKLRQILLEVVPSRGIEAALALGIWMVVCRSGHAVCRDGTPSIATSGNEGPEFVEGADLAWKTAGHTHNGDGGHRVICVGHNEGVWEEYQDIRYRKRQEEKGD